MKSAYQVRWISVAPLTLKFSVTIIGGFGYVTRIPPPPVTDTVELPYAL